MADDEWAAIALLLAETFVQTPDNRWTDAKDAAYRASLGDREPAQVLAAVKRLQNEGHGYIPSVPAIVAKVDDDPTVPTWPEVFSCLQRMFGVRRGPGESADDAALRHARETCHEWAALFFAEVGLGNLRQLPIDDPDYGQLERDRLRHRWEEWTGRARERQAAGLPATIGAVRARLGMRRFDPVASLGLAPARESAGELEPGEGNENADGE